MEKTIISSLNEELKFIKWRCIHYPSTTDDSIAYLSDLCGKLESIELDVKNAMEKIDTLIDKLYAKHSERME